MDYLKEIFKELNKLNYDYRLKQPFKLINDIIMYLFVYESELKRYKGDPYMYELLVEGKEKEFNCSREYDKVLDLMMDCGILELNDGKLSSNYILINRKGRYILLERSHKELLYFENKISILRFIDKRKFYNVVGDDSGIINCVRSKDYNLNITLKFNLFNSVNETNNKPNQTIKILDYLVIEDREIEKIAKENYEIGDITSFITLKRNNKCFESRFGKSYFSETIGNSILYYHHVKEFLEDDEKIKNELIQGEMFVRGYLFH